MRDAVVVLCLGSTAAAIWLALAPARVAPGPAAHRAAGPPTGDDPGPDRDVGWLQRYRWPLAVLAGLGALVLLPGPAGWVAAVGAGATCRVVVARSEAPAERRRRDQVVRDLPHVVALFAAALRSGASPGPALLLVAEALPGPASEPGRVVAARLALGADPVQAWRWLAGEPGLASWGRAMGRAHETGASVVIAVERLAADLAAQARAEVEDQARTVGVRAALPLGVCLLPAFLLVGIVPVVAGLLASLW